MKYIRMEDGIYRNASFPDDLIIICRGRECEINPSGIINQADTIEELCDAFVLYSIDIRKFTVFPVPLPLQKNAEINVDYEQFGAIWTDKGLIFVAKMNEKGDLELL